jgi:hypothetical protein
MASTNCQLLTPLGVSKPQSSGCFHYLLKITVGSNVFLPMVLFCR